MEILVGVYLFFIFVSLYSIFLVLLIFLRNRGRLYEDNVTDKIYSLSVVVPAYNKEDSILGTINAIKNVDYPRDQLEIIVVDDGSKDKTVENLKK